MSQIGFATSIGLVFEVPILLRSLADSLAEVNLDHLPLAFHPSLLAVLDDGVTQELTSSLVPSYDLDWWRHDSEPAADSIMAIDSLDQCLHHHMQFFPDATAAPVATPAPDATPAPGATPAPAPVAAPAPTPDCQSCINLRDLVNDMLHEQRSTLLFLDGCQTSADAALNTNVRKAAGFYQLHELALLKELRAEPQKPPQPAGQPSRQTAVRRKSELVAANAQAELDRLKSLPPGAYKWSWGVDITENDVLGAHEKNTKSRGKQQHSGYALSLPDGAKGKKEWSSTPMISTVASNAHGRPPTVSGNASPPPSPGSSPGPSPSPGPGPTPGPTATPGPGPDALPVAEAGHPTASLAAMGWQGEDDESSADEPTGFQAAMAWQGGDDPSSDGDEPTGFRAAMAWQGDNNASSDGDEPTGFQAATAWQGDNDQSPSSPTGFLDSDAETNSDLEDSMGTSQIQNPTPSRITLPTHYPPVDFTLPIYTPADFSYVDETWLSSSDEMDE